VRHPGSSSERCHLSQPVSFVARIKVHQVVAVRNIANARGFPVRIVTQVFENVFAGADRNVKIATASKTLSFNLQFTASATIFSPAHAVILAIVARTIRDSYKVHDALTFAQPVWNNLKIWVLIADHDCLCIIQNRIDTIYH